MEKMEYLLKELGLTKYETKSYLALLQLERSITAYKLSKFCGVPFGRVYDVMENLVSKGIVALEPGKPKRFRAIEPKVAISALLTKKELEWQKTKIEIKEIINKLQKKSVSEEPLNVIKGKETLLWELLDAYDKAKKEVLIIAGELSAKRKGIDLESITKEKITKGVRFKIIVPSFNKAKDPVKRLRKMGAQIREHPLKGIRLNLIDEKLCFLSIEDKNLPFKSVTIIMNSLVFGKTMKKFFDCLWDKSL